MAYGSKSSPVKLVNTTGATIPTNTFAVVGNHVGLCVKTAQLTRWVEPGSEAATHIQIGETFEMYITGVHEVAAAGALASVEVNDKLWIDPATQAVLTAPGGGAGAANEVESVKVQATGGTFKLTFEGDQTAAIAFNATAGQVQAALEALENVNSGDLTVTGGPGDEGGTKPYVVTFGGRYADTNVTAITADATALTGGEHKITVTTTTEGNAGADASEIMPLGVIDEIDTVRTPHVARVNLDDLKPFLGGL